MFSGNRQEKEIKTIREKNIKIRLSEADCERVARLCGKHGITVPQLLENFIGDLVSGTYSNGSDERDLADQWFNRCWFGMFPDKTLINFLMDDWYHEPESIFELEKDIAENTDLLEYLIKEQEEEGEDNEEEIEALKIDIQAWEDELEEIKIDFLKENPSADWEEEVAKLREWYQEKKRFIEE